MYLNEVIYVILVSAVAILLAVILRNVVSNMSRHYRKKKALAYAEFSDYKMNIELYVIGTNVYRREAGVATKVRTGGSRNRALMEFTNLCAGVAKEIYDRG